MPYTRMAIPLRYIATGEGYVMPMNETYMSGYQSRIEFLKNEFIKFKQFCDDNSETIDLVAWYMKYGISIGIEREDLLTAISDQPDLLKIATDLDENEIYQGKYPPEFRLGDQVEVKVNAKNMTYHRGTISSLQWHFKDSKWYYQIEENGKKIGKRYFSDDLTKTKA